MLIGTLCISCGASLEKELDSARKVQPLTAAEKENKSLMIASADGKGTFLTLRKDGFGEVSTQHSNRLLKEKKLALILDLDHTIVHATKPDPALIDPQTGEIMIDRLDRMYPCTRYTTSIYNNSNSNITTNGNMTSSLNGTPVLGAQPVSFGLDNGNTQGMPSHPSVDLTRPEEVVHPIPLLATQFLPPMAPGEPVRQRHFPAPLLLKLRPGARRFLREVSNLYDIAVYTMGERPYAEQVVKLLDPDGTLIGNRYFSGCDFGDRAVKHIDKMMACDRRMVVILDDSPKVWPGLYNVLEIFPYR